MAARFGELGLSARVLEDPETWAHEEAGWTLVAHPAALPGEAAAPAPLALARAWPFGFSPSASGRAPLALETGAGVARVDPQP